jgi:uncharacterized protein (TIGR00251 family)
LSPTVTAFSSIAQSATIYNRAKREARDTAAHRRSTTNTPNACTLAIKATPHAPRHEITGWLGDALKVKIHAPALEGRANDALCAFLATTLHLPRRAVTILRGDTSRQKIVRITGASLLEVKTKLAALTAPLKTRPRSL